MNIGKWLLTAAAAIVVVGAGVVLHKQNKNRGSAKLQEGHDVDELTQADAREILRVLYTVNAEDMFGYINNPRVLLGGAPDGVMACGQSDEPLGLTDFVARLEARANVLSTETILDADDKVTLLNSGYDDGRLPLNVGHWWSKAGATPEPNFYELTEMLTRAKK